MTKEPAEEKEENLGEVITKRKTNEYIISTPDYVDKLPVPRRILPRILHHEKFNTFLTDGYPPKTIVFISVFKCDKVLSCLNDFCSYLK